MKAICAVCGREYEVSAEAPLGNCVSCGGKLKALITTSVVAVNPVSEVSASSEPIELAGESEASGVTCPNCGKWIEAGAQICTACGYSRRLARTLTTRVGTPEVLQVKFRSAPGAPEAPEIEAERAHRRARERGRIGRGDAMRLFVSTLFLLALGAMVMAASSAWFGLNVPLKMPALLQPPKFDALNAGLMLLLFFGVTLPITAAGVRVAAAITAIETSTRLRWLRTAGSLAGALLTIEILFTVDQMFLHLETQLLIATLAAAACLAMVAFTCYLHDVGPGAAIVLTLAMIISAALGLLAAAATFGWISGRVGIDPVIRPITTWSWRWS